MSITAITNVSGITPDLGINSVEAPEAQNLIDVASSRFAENFGELLTQQADVVNASKSLDITSAVDSKHLAQVQAAVDEYAINTQLTSKVASSLVKSIDGLVHIQ